MKIVFGLIALAGSLAAAPAFAINPTIDEAIRSRPDLSSFYEALVNSGVNQELQPGVRYTVFAPINEAFAEINAQKYPCFYAAACRPEIADIVRNHIVQGEVHLTDAVKHKGGLHSIDQRFIAINRETPTTYTVESGKVLSTNQLAGGMLYKIDDIISNEREMATFEHIHYAYVPVEYGYVPGEQVTTSTVTEPLCTGNYCPEVRETTTVTRTSPVFVPLAVARPAR